MKILIDIPEKYYNQAIEYGYLSINDIEFADRIKSGVVLPKGHGRLIDADALEYDKESVATDSDIEYYVIGKEDIDAAPTIIEADKEM